MAYLFRFTTKPNQPVCKAELIFYTVSDDHMRAAERLVDLIDSNYPFNYATHPDAKLEYLGEFTPLSHAMFKDWVITYQNGEY